MHKTKTVTVYKALGYEWQDSDAYQGYIPEGQSWEAVVEQFTAKRHGLNNPMPLRLHKQGSPLSVLLYECKDAGEVLSLSDEITRNAQFVLCTLVHSQKKVVIYLWCENM